MSEPVRVGVWSRAVQICSVFHMECCARTGVGLSRRRMRIE